MVTAILPSLTDETGPAAEIIRGPATPGGRPSVRLSVDSEATITPNRLHGDSNQTSADGEEPPSGTGSKGKSSALAGYVGLFTGCGALVALVLFLPLPARFSHVDGVTFADAIKDSFYIVGAISFLVAIFVFFGLRGLQGEEGKGFRTLFGWRGTTPQGAGSNSTATLRNVRDRQPPPHGTSHFKTLN
jgi:hypothetical protein